jgi:hypothetical protein
MFGFKHQAKQAQGPCTHPKAMPRWDNVEEAGQADKISRLYCPDCDTFIPSGELSA